MFKKISSILVAFLLSTCLLYPSITGMAQTSAEAIDDLKNSSKTNVIIDTDTTIDSDITITGKTVTIKNKAKLTVANGGSLIVSTGSFLNIEEGTLVDNNTAGNRVWDNANFAGTIVVTSGSEVYTGTDCYIADYNRDPDADIALRFGTITMAPTEWTLSLETKLYVNSEINTALKGEGLCTVDTGANGKNTNATSTMEAGKSYWWFKNSTSAYNWTEIDLTKISDVQYLFGTIIPWIQATNENGMKTETWTENTQGKTYTDLVYNKERDYTNTYDLIVPANAPKDKYVGVILFIHGGSWTGGEKTEQTYMCQRYAKLGYITATIDYRLAGTEDDPTVNLYDMLDDITECISAINSKITELGYKSNKLAISGYSSGGHLAAWYAYSRPQDSAIPLKMLFEQAGPTDFHESLMGFNWDSVEGNMWAIADLCAGKDYTYEQYKSGEFEDVINSISPVAFISENSVPSLVAYAGLDTTCCTGQRDSILKALKDNNVEYKFIDFAKSSHMLEFDHQAAVDYYNTSVEYLARYIGSVDVTDIKLDKDKLDMNVGDSAVTLNASLQPTNADPGSFTWKSSNEAVATVDANGKVTPVSAGTATITVSNGDKSATCEVTVKGNGAAGNVGANNITGNSDTTGNSQNSANGTTSGVDGLAKTGDAENIVAICLAIAALSGVAVVYTMRKKSAKTR